MRSVSRVTGVIAVSLFNAGCGTLHSFGNFKHDTPVVYSGSRLNIAAMGNDQAALDKFGMEAPTHPKADLPLSMVADTILLPGTLAVAAYRKLFW